MDEQQPQDSDLLEEYKLCAEKVFALDGNVWKTATMFSIGSILGLITLSQSFSALPNTFIPVISLCVVGILIVWWRYARRWWSIQQLTLLRMRHIEKHLRLGMTSYVDFRDTFDQNPQDARLPSHLEVYKEDIIKLPNFDYHGIQPMTKFVVGVSILSWLVSPMIFFATATRVWQNSDIAITCIFIIVFFGFLKVQWKKP